MSYNKNRKEKKKDREITLNFNYNIIGIIRNILIKQINNIKENYQP